MAIAARIGAEGYVPRGPSAAVRAAATLNVCRCVRAAITMLGALLVLGLAPAAPGAGLADRVDVFAGTEPGAHTFGGGHNFPGATLPFGMVQWGPDTVPAERHSGGYDYRDRHISGFSLTHLSGAGCALYGDFPFLPTTEPIGVSPAARGGGLSGRFQPGFSHADERASPGFYSAHLNPVGGGAIDTELTATTRTGMARFAFPRSPHASVLIDAGGSAKADDLAEVQIDPDERGISGSASSGYFCAQRPRYRVYFAAVFDRPFDAYGTWTRQQLAPGSTAAVDLKPPRRSRPTPPRRAPTQASTPGATGSSRSRVGISFVSVAGARANLAAESGGASFRRIASAAEASWNRALASIRVGGGSRRRPRHLLHGALPRAARAPHLRRRRRPLRRDGRRRPRRRRPHPVRGPLGLGHLPHPDPAAGDADAAPRERRRRLDARRCGRRAAACRAGPTPTGRA